MIKKELIGVDELKRTLVGATITDVLPSQAYEGPQFILIVKRGQKTFKVEVCGTDMGWWFTEERLKR